MPLDDNKNVMIRKISSQNLKQSSICICSIKSSHVISLKA